MQKWEYKTIIRVRGWEAKKQGYEFHVAGSKWNVDIDKTLLEFGEDGWELVTVTPRSSIMGGYNDGYSAHHHDYAGFTDQELWVFKRPRP